MRHPPSDERNPFESPKTEDTLAGGETIHMSAFSIAAVTAALLLCGAQIPIMAAFALVMASALTGWGSPLFVVLTACELASGLAIIFFGIPGNIGILCRQSWGVSLGQAFAFSVLASCAISVCWMVLSESLGGLVFFAYLSIRGAVLAAYVVALRRLARPLTEQDRIEGLENLVDLGE